MVGLGDPISGRAVVPSGDRQKKRSEDKTGWAAGAETGCGCNNGATSVHLGDGAQAPPTDTPAASICLHPETGPAAQPQAYPSPGMPVITQVQKSGFYGLGSHRPGDTYEDILIEAIVSIPLIWD